MEQGKLDDAEKHNQGLPSLKVRNTMPTNLSILGCLKLRQEKYGRRARCVEPRGEARSRNPEIENYLGVTLGHKGPAQAGRKRSCARRFNSIPINGPAHNIWR